LRAETLGGALDAARRHVTEDLTVGANEDDTVSGRVALIPFQFLIWDGNSRSVRDEPLPFVMIATYCSPRTSKLSASKASASPQHDICGLSGCISF
jgi:hypothetical protein